MLRFGGVRLLARPMPLPALPVRAMSTHTMKSAREAGITLPEGFLPTQTPEGKWKKPTLSRRKIAKMRKDTLLRGEEWPWEKESKRVPGAGPVRRKGKKVELTRAARLLRIEEKMKSMPEKLEAHKRERQARKVRRHEDYFVLFDKPFNVQGESQKKKSKKKK